MEMSTLFSFPSKNQINAQGAATENPGTCFFIVNCYLIAYRTSVCQRMKNITHTLVYADIRWSTLSYADMSRQNIILSMFKNCVRSPTYGLYAKHTLGIR